MILICNLLCLLYIKTLESRFKPFIKDTSSKGAACGEHVQLLLRLTGCFAHIVKMYKAAPSSSGQSGQLQFILHTLGDQIRHSYSNSNITSHVYPNTYLTCVVPNLLFVSFLVPFLEIF